MQAYGSVGVVARGEDAAVTVLHTLWRAMRSAGGKARVQGGGGPAVEIGAGQAAVWRAGEEHVTWAEEEVTALVVEMAALPLTL